MEKAVPIETELGILNGRDCIYLDVTEQDDRNNMIIAGEINGALISNHKNEKEWFAYQLTFKRVLACFFCELDTYQNLVGTENHDGSSFDLIEESKWLQTLPIRKDFEKSIYKHYRLFTYDMVYHIAAVDYQLELEGSGVEKAADGRKNISTAFSDGINFRE